MLRRPMTCFRSWFVFAAVLAVGCSPSIGDDCEFSSDCSVNGDRICDTAQPGGYCTVRDCEEDTCPEDSVCVRWRRTPSRIAQSWCMATCGGGGDCRDEYDCVTAAELGDPRRTRPVDAEVLDDDKGQKFCVAETSASMPQDADAVRDGG